MEGDNKSFTKEEVFDADRYETCLTRLRYDDRDVIMYTDMLDFLWQYAIRPHCLEDYQGLLGEYTRWNMQMIEKCFYHHPHDRPYADIRRAYQTVIHLLDGDLEKGLKQFDDIGWEAFQYDGRAPKRMMTKDGKCYEPVSRLFLLYNYDKVLRVINKQQAEAFRQKYSYAFTCFRDGEHETHDAFLRSQLETYRDEIFYPVFERVYKSPWTPMDFYLYFEEGKSIPVAL